MCLLIVSKGKRIPWEVVQRAAIRNKDGFGLSFYNKSEGRMNIIRSLHLEVLKQAMNAIPKGSVHMVHLRFATSGKVDKETCHPFRINKHMTFAHNGMVQGLGNKEESDSRMIADMLAKFLGPDAARLGKHEIRMLHGLAGGSNKFAVGTPDGITLFNSHLGEWDNQKHIWYSDSQYNPDHTWPQTMTLTQQSVFTLCSKQRCLRKREKGSDICTECKNGGPEYTWEDQKKEAENNGYWNMSGKTVYNPNVKQMNFLLNQLDEEKEK